MDERDKRYERPVEAVSEGEWAGWKRWVLPDSFEDMCGPFYLAKVYPKS